MDELSLSMPPSYPHTAEHLRVASIMERSTVNGPGERTVIWFQGCPFHCKECFNPEFLSMDGGHERSAQELLGWIHSVTGTEGVTFSGGEPFAQAVALLPLVRELKKVGTSIVIFTGYEESELMKDPIRKEIVGMCDLIVAGPYVKELSISHPLLASSNQTLSFISDRYDDTTFSTTRQSCEFTLAADGTVSVTGFPPSLS